MQRDQDVSQEMPNEWKSRFLKWQASGLSAQAWCRENQVSYSAFSYWRQKSSSDPNLISDLSSEMFIELSDSSDVSHGLTLEYRGVTIFVSKRFNEDLLKRCLKVLKEI